MRGLCVRMDVHTDRRIHPFPIQTSVLESLFISRSPNGGSRVVEVMEKGQVDLASNDKNRADHDFLVEQFRKSFMVNGEDRIRHDGRLRSCQDGRCTMDEIIPPSNANRVVT
ncbi:hypothetical protein MRB53_040186 [Persea americana]|nr:hypothetical protein MRB53_040186 [Persea americana]